jgi:hypothetical protein
MYFLISMTQDFRRMADAIRSQLVIRDYLTSSLNNIRANPAAHQSYFSSDSNEVQDFLNNNIAFAFDPYQWTTVLECPYCPGRAGFVMHPLDLGFYRGVYKVNFCALWERGTSPVFNCEGRGVSFLVSQ